MAAERACANCGSWVGPDTKFCPACGTAIVDSSGSHDLPPAPVWPDSQAGAPHDAAGADDAERESRTDAAGRQPPESEPRPAEVGDRSPITVPTTLSGWLIGIGAAVGGLALVPSLVDALSLILFLALLGVAATVFVAERLPTIPRLRLAVLSIGMVGLGIGLERAAFGARGADSILLLAMISVAGGALLVELDRDRPLPPPER